ncbi:UvrD-helicase domain-containing protein [Dethiobacter alkaliphilus]|uniref:UvrD-helicase domain-containing protein n=1 Tax=Dethiobacter alkaliphilus TaxID=427926 RepID=UPI0022277D1E|nr:UvrD-helicase domain-containing protein [Dethiobacter alkaliphilus]MCW3490496.1 UvrD-helicase domain-containing protein [Dethiobacter alkaliphilus]
MNRVQLQDEQARQAIKTRLTETFLVEAGAGSGKTTSLVQRMTALISTGQCQMENMAAVTFTRKAAGELRERFQEKLEKEYQSTTDPTTKQTLETALSQLDRAFIGTIHSFCSRLLRERPVEAGMSPDFTEIEGLEEKILAQTAWEEYLLEVRFTQPQLLKQIRQIDVSPQDLKEAYHQLTLYPDVELATTSAPYPDFAPARKSLNDLLLLAETALPLNPPDGGWDQLQRLLRQALRWRRFFDLNDDRNLIRLLSKLNKKKKVVQKKWLTKETAKQIQAFFDHFRESDIQPTLRQWWEYRYPHLLEFLLPAVAHFQTVRQRENQVNFQDLLMRTAALLKNNSEVRGYFQNRYTHLLVDEFQDTDPIQAEIMMFLTGCDLTETDWTKISPKPGALFVVGDPKQSIYRFRRADIDTYNRVKDLIKKANGEVLHLTANFRSLTEIIDWVNPVFNDLLTQSVAPYQADAVSMQPVRKNHPDNTGGIFKIEIPGITYHKQETIVSEDAARIAAWIRTCLDGNVTLTRTAEEEQAGLSATPSPNDFLILVRYKDYMSLYARALEEYNIPFSLSGASDIAASLELQELHLLLQALADPDNPVPLVATLRGLFFGVSDEDLYRLKKANGRFCLLSPIPDDPTVENFIPIWEQLQQYRAWTRELPPSSAIENIISDLGLIPYALAGSMGKGRTGYILQLLELIRSREQNGQTTFPATVDFFSELLEVGMEEELDVEAGIAPAVRIMNLHKAKGLEAPVVFLANPGKTVTREPNLHVSRTSGTPKGYLQISKRENYASEIFAQPTNWEVHQAEETLYQQAEEARLLYVAATRAKNILIISTYPAKADKSPWYPLEEFMESIPTLDIPQVQLPAKEESQTQITPETLQAVNQQIQENIARVITPTYTRCTVTDLTKDAEAPERRYTGRGMSWGNVIHNALEALVKYENIDLEALIPQLLQQEGRAEDEKEEVLALLQEITETPFWQRVQRASEKHTEVPFGIYENDHYLTGTIDLAFREKEGWVLVDYKTDTVRDDAHRQELVTYYTLQLKEYAKRWEEMTGERVKAKGILLIDEMFYASI